MKFTINNRKDDVIQVLVWENYIIDSIRKIVMPKNVIHIFIYNLEYFIYYLID